LQCLAYDCLHVCIGKRRGPTVLRESSTALNVNVGMQREVMRDSL
jgi:hypothetical protein